MWGTDWTRAVGKLTYEQGVEAFRVTDRLSDSDRALLMGERSGASTTGRQPKPDRPDLAFLGSPGRGMPHSSTCRGAAGPPRGDKSAGIARFLISLTPLKHEEEES